MHLSNANTDQLTLLIVHAHPDDESISTGGILAKYSTNGIHTVLTYCTRGEAGDILNPEFVSPQPGLSITEIRAIELKKAVDVLGVKSVHFLGYRDSGMAGTAENHHPLAFAQADPQEATSRLVEIIRRVRPHVIVTYNEKGTYLHPDHIMANKVTLLAFKASGDPGYTVKEEREPWRPAKLYYTAIPLERIRRMHRIIVARGEKPNFDPEVLGTPEEKISAVIDVRKFLSQKLAALNCHQSQMNPNSILRRMPEELREEALGYEHFECMYGCPATGQKETDLFEGLRR
ncbi:MAG: PIG-L family deacetylase [Desulfobacterales bacterium]|nr:MAG: PIG-L family deacetylase [Desulfobacterales bacterium]